MAMETLNTLTTQGRHQLIVMGGQRDKQPLRYTHTPYTQIMGIEHPSILQ